MGNIIGSQIRAGRALLRWRAEDLATASGVGVATIRRAELIDGVTNMTAPNSAAIRAALEAAGVQFLDNGATAAGAGVALRRDPADQPEAENLNAANDSETRDSASG